MNAHKAKEIMESAGVIEVLYNGHPVWLQEVKGNAADVILLNSDQHISVPLEGLVEGEELPIEEI